MSRLDRIKDWEELAAAANFKVSRLAKLCCCSVRQLERYFAQTQRQSPHEWLHEVRMQRAVELLRDKTPVKQVAYMLGYRQPSHFMHDFKRYYGVSPRKFSNAASGVAARENVAF